MTCKENVYLMSLSYSEMNVNEPIIYFKQDVFQ